MKSIYKNIIVSCLSLILLIIPTKFAQSCGDSEYYSIQSITYFNKAALNDAKFEAFYYDFRPYYAYDYYYLGENIIHKKMDYIRNCEEWRMQIKDATIDDIYKVVYETKMDSFFIADAAGQLAVFYPQNTFMKALLRPENKELLEYLKLAFRIDLNHSSRKVDGWLLSDEPENYQKKLIETKAIIEIIENKLKTRLSLFLKERYAYQLLVNYRYANDYKNCIDVFDVFLKDSKSILKSWAYVHVGHAYYKQDKIPESNLALAMAYYGCESKKMRVLKGFTYEGYDDYTSKKVNYFEPTLALTQTNEEKIAIYAIKGNLPGQSLDAIQTIIELKPDYDYLPLLIAKEINKIEDWLITPFLSNQKALVNIGWNEQERTKQKLEAANYRSNYYGFDYKNYQKDVAYLKAFRAELLKLNANKGNTKYQDFLNLAIGHLYFLDFQPEEALVYFNKVSKTAAPAIQTQTQIEKVLVLPQLKDITDKKVQEELVASLELLKKNKENKAHSVLHLYLFKHFYDKKQDVEAALFYGLANGVAGHLRYSNYYQAIEFFDKYTTEKEVQKVIETLTSKEKTVLQTYLFKGYETYDETQDKWTITDFTKQLWEVKGMLAFRKDNLESAYQSFNQLPDDYWQTTYAFRFYLNQNPFEDTEKLPEGWYDANKGKKNYFVNKKEIIQKLMDLKKQPTAENLYILGNAYYNFTISGNNWMMFSYSKDFQDYYPNLEKYDTVYYHYARAFDYYKQVANHPKASLELKAQATLMMGKIDNHQINYQSNEREISHYFIELKKNFKAAKNYSYLMWCTNIN